MSTVLPATAGLDFSQTLSSILTAILDAQRKAAETTIEYIHDVGLRDEGAGKTRLKSTSFRYTKLDANDDYKEFELELPLLSMVPIPAISVSKANIKFSYEVLGTREPTKSEGVSLPLTGFVLPTTGKLNLIGRVAKKTDETEKASGKAQLDIEIEIESAAATGGLDRILDILELAISDRQVEEP